MIDRFHIKEGLFFNPKIKFDKFILADASDMKGMPRSLNNLKTKYNSRYIFLTIADIKNNNNIFVAINNDTERLLEKCLGVSFNEKGIAYNKELLLRKQILPRLINDL